MLLWISITQHAHNAYFTSRNLLIAKVGSDWKSLRTLTNRNGVVFTLRYFLYRKSEWLSKKTSTVWTCNHSTILYWLNSSRIQFPTWFIIVGKATLWSSLIMKVMVVIAEIYSVQLHTQIHAKCFSSIFFHLILKQNWGTIITSFFRWGLQC